MDLNAWIETATTWEILGGLGIVYFFLIYFSIGLEMNHSNTEGKMDFCDHILNLSMIFLWLPFFIFLFVGSWFGLVLTNEDVMNW